MAKKTEAKAVPNNLTALIAACEGIAGAGAIIIGNSRVAGVKGITTGIPSLDNALGVAGLPQGRIIEVFGAESSGKTTTALQMIAAVQQETITVGKDSRPGCAAFIDAEHALDTQWATNLGVKVDKLLISQPDYGEQALQIAELMVKSRQVDLVVIDSVAALTPKKELEGEVGDSHIGAQARMMSQALRKLAAAANQSHCTVVFINQIREKIGVMFGSNETTPGGRGLRFYASVRIDIRRVAAIKDTTDKELHVANRVKAKVVKNKVAPPFTVAEYDICFGTPVYGVDRIASLLETAVIYKVIAVKGSFHSFNDVSLGNGKKNAIAALRKDDDLAAKVKEQLYPLMLKGIATGTNIIDQSDEELAEGGELVTSDSGFDTEE